MICRRSPLVRMTDTELRIRIGEQYKLHLKMCSVISCKTDKDLKKIIMSVAY